MALQGCSAPRAYAFTYAQTPKGRVTLTLARRTISQRANREPGSIQVSQLSEKTIGHPYMEEIAE